MQILIFPFFFYTLMNLASHNLVISSFDYIINLWVKPFLRLFVQLELHFDW
jgi:hypothetical protein